MANLPYERSGDSEKIGKISAVKALQSNQAKRVACKRVAHAICS